MRLAIPVLFACLAYLPAVASAAQAADPIPESPQAARALAEKIFHEAAEAYTAGDYEKAATLWQKSYDLSKEPELFENIGNAYERLGRAKAARDALAKWRDVAPAAERAILDRRIANLDARIAREDAETARREEEADKLREENEEAARARQGGGGKISIPGVVIGSIGVAFVITGVTIAAVGAGERPEEDAQSGACKTVGDRNVCKSSAAVSIDNANTKVIVGDVFWITGAVAAAIGGALVVAEAVSGADEEKPDDTTVGVLPMIELPVGRASGTTLGAIVGGTF